ncbi:MAG: hypothetical protein EHM70_10800 [Chloroflexota bacterium]|nr:MAG: hypothetical protein EHM70_10800 [Chloroflexota bacterium]
MQRVQIHTLHLFWFYNRAMKITCLSASNIEVAKDHSASTRACHIIAEIATGLVGDAAEIEIIPLIDYDLVSCRMCGSCFKTCRCAHDPAFNQLFEKLLASDGIFLVCPHYAPIPSKVAIILEKMEEMAYLNWCGDPNFKFGLHGKPVGVVAHGGQTEEALPYYKTGLVEPLANALASVQMQVVSGGNEWPKGVAFGITCLTQPEDSIFVTIEHDWPAIRERIQPLVRNLFQALK